MIRNATVGINIGPDRNHIESLLALPNLTEWNIQDIRNRSIEEVRKIRDEIEKKVRGLAADLNKKNF